ncbi:MAG: 50S ribosomal protein L34 [Candidatus Margulisiibacteriota bacterium]
MSTKQTYQPHKKSRKKTHGFLVRSKTTGGKRVLSRRRKKGRKSLTV